MKRTIAFALLIAAIPLSSHASCTDWGLYAVQVAQMRNGGLAKEAAEGMMWQHSLSGALDGEKNETSFNGFDPVRAKEVIKSVYELHHAP